MYPSASDSRDVVEQSPIFDSVHCRRTLVQPDRRRGATRAALRCIAWPLSQELVAMHLPNYRSTNSNNSTHLAISCGTQHYDIANVHNIP